MELALVLWSGALGGAEQFTATLAHEMATAGADPTVVFLGSDRPLSERLEAQGIPYRSLGLSRGSHVLGHTRQFARLVASCGQAGAILDSSGFVPAALRFGGYRGQVVSVEHGILVVARTLPRARRLIHAAERASCSWAPDVEVAVSDFVLRALLRHPHARRVTRIHNGLDLGIFVPPPGPPSSHRGGLVIGWVGRMVSGKGVFELLHAVSILRREIPIEVRLAGDGPERSALEELAKQLAVDPYVFFAGPLLHVPSFWAACDVGVFPTNGWIESFGLAAAEAMACGRPVVASRSGGLEEVVDDGRAGVLVEPGDIEALAEALRRYARDESLRGMHGREARKVCEERFDIRDTARKYLALFRS